jgi:hypothetical protein
MKIASLALILTSGFCAVAVASPAATGDAGHPRLVCLQPHMIQESKVVSDTVIDFHMRDGKVWRNVLPHKCPGLKFESGFRWDITGDEVCSNLQTITVLRRGNTCMLGAFTEYTPEPTPAQQ